jgi:hypothetical protein
MRALDDAALRAPAGLEEAGEAGWGRYAGTATDSAARREV